MIVYNFKNVEDFLSKIPLIVGNDIFSQYIEPHSSHQSNTNQHKLILQFLGYADAENGLTILYQCQLKLKSKGEKTKIIEKLKEAFENHEHLNLIEGYINEIIMSIS